MENENVEAAQEQLGDETSAASSDMVPEGDEETATGPTEQGPRGLDRLLRTDRSIDLEDQADVWDPEGNGGPNRLAAAARQAFGADHWPPAVHGFIAVLETMALLLTGAFAFGSDEDEDDQDDQQDQRQQERRAPQ